MQRIGLASVAVLLGSVPLAAQTPDQLAGVWSVVKIETVAPDGKRTPAFGDNPHTQLILTANGYFSQFFMRSDVPKFASNNRMTGTPEENAAVVKGATSAIGTYTIADKVVTLNMTASTFPNWTGTSQPRPIVSFSGDELVWRVPAASGGNSIETVWRRLK
jgi:hypothetical protein